MATSADPGHRSRMRQTQFGASLQLPQQHARLDAGGKRERWCLDLAPQPLLTSPRSHTSGLSVADTDSVYVRLDIDATGRAFDETTGFDPAAVAGSVDRFGLSARIRFRGENSTRRIRRQHRHGRRRQVAGRRLPAAHVLRRHARDQRHAQRARGRRGALGRRLRQTTGSPDAPDVAISLAIRITVRDASVVTPCRDSASAMCRVTGGSTIRDDCNRQLRTAAEIA